jgi:hypothetical protein
MCVRVYKIYKAEQPHMGPSHSHNAASRRVSLVQGLILFLSAEDELILLPLP